MGTLRSAKMEMTRGRLGAALYCLSSMHCVNSRGRVPEVVSDQQPCGDKGPIIIAHPSPLLANRQFMWGSLLATK